MRRLLPGLLAGSFALLMAGSAQADWTATPLGPTVLPGITVDWTAPDGTGGLFFSYRQTVSPYGPPLPEIVGRIDANLERDPRWSLTGLGTTLPDGHGGLFAAIGDSLNTALLIRRYRADAAPDPDWPAQGVRVDHVDQGQLGQIGLVPDGNGGAIVVATQVLPDSHYALLAQRVGADGSIDPVWGADPKFLITSFAPENPGPVLLACPDGSGGVYAGWSIFDHSVVVPPYDYYNVARATACHVLAGGVIEGAALLQPLPRYEERQRVLSFSAAPGGFQVAFQNGFAASAEKVRYDHQFSATAVAPLPNMVAFAFCWDDDGGGSFHVATPLSQVQLLHTRVDGTPFPDWPANGVAIDNPDLLSVEGLVADGQGGAFVLRDYRLGGTRAQHVLASGELDPAWPRQGQRVAPGTTAVRGPYLLRPGVAFVTWTDNAGTSFQRLSTPDNALAVSDLRLEDVPADQGGRLRAVWNAGPLQLPPWSATYAHRLFRSPALPDGARQWTEVTILDATAASYAVEIPDSSAGAAGMVVRVDTFDPGGERIGSVESAPTQSIDNLPPLAPQGFAGSPVPAGMRLSWSANHEPDLAAYRIYRGTFAGFVPSPANRIAQVTTTELIDATPGGTDYKLEAIDVHGNASPAVALSLANIVGVTPVATALTLAQPVPSPARDRATVRWTLPVAGVAGVRVFDAAGRQVAVLASGFQEAGEHEREWTLRDTAGRPLAPGVYLVRLEAARVIRLQRLAVVR